MEQKRLFQTSTTILLALLALLSFSLLNVKTFVEYVARYDVGSLSYFYEQLGNVNIGVPVFLDSILTPNIVTFIFWLAAGFVSYTIISALSNEATEIMEQIRVAKLYVHPKNFQEKKFWIFNSIEIILSLLFVALIIGWIILSVEILLPYSRYTFIISLYDTGSMFESILLIIESYVSVLLVFVTIYLIYRITLALRDRFA